MLPNGVLLCILANDTLFFMEAALTTMRMQKSGTVSAALTIDEAADYLRVCRSTLYKLFREGQLKPAKVGGRTLVRRVDADAFLERCVA